MIFSLPPSHALTTNFFGPSGVRRGLLHFILDLSTFAIAFFVNENKTNHMTKIASLVLLIFIVTMIVVALVGGLTQESSPTKPVSKVGLSLEEKLQCQNDLKEISEWFDPEVWQGWSYKEKLTAVQKQADKVGLGLISAVMFEVDWKNCGPI